ncbi:MAG: InlB B-repeat-containing protein [Prevotellaceae bacterium]|nr:InlB B-repeat-containing protein [Prevotellaceae bacterium]
MITSKTNKLMTAAVALLLVVASCGEDTVVTETPPELTPELSVDKTTIDAATESGTYAVAVTANVPWTAASSDAWCTVSPTSGEGDGTLAVAVAANDDIVARTATLTVTAEGVAAKTIAVTQAAKPVYGVSFNSNGGSAVASIAGVRQGQTLDSLPEPTKDGYVFEGWFTDATFGSRFTTTTAVTADVTLYAKWTIEPIYTVTFNSNDGSAVDPIAGIRRGQTLDSLPEPTKDGYVFEGWFTDDTTFAIRFTTATPITADITVYAQWTTEPLYTVTFDSNGGSAVASIGGIRKGQTVASLPANPTKASHIFEGWFTDNTTFATPFTTATAVAADITVYAKWTPTYTVTFNSNGGSAVASVSGLLSGQKLASLPANPTKAGNVFGGWFTDNTTFTTQFTTATAVAADITVYAKWTPTYTVTFNSNGGSAVASISGIEHGKTVSSIPTPTKANSVFQGWFSDNGSFLNVFDATKPVTANITVYAKWKVWLTAPAQPAATTTTPNTSLFNGTVSGGQYYIDKVRPIVLNYPDAEQSTLINMFAGIPMSVVITEEEYRKSITLDKTLYEYTDWHNADHTLSVTISDINGASVSASITEVVSLTLGSAKVGNLSASITRETTSTVAKVQALTTQSTWDLREFNPAYQYKVIVTGRVDIHDFYWSQAYVGTSLGRYGPFSAVKVQTDTVQMILISRLKP